MLRYRLACVMACLVFSGMVMAEDRAELWKKVDRALQDEGLPQTAIGHLDAIIQSATSDKAFDEVIKAVGRKRLIEAQLEGGDAIVSITGLRGDLPNLPVPTHPVVKAILANWYWMYYQQNRWRFMNRTQMAGGSGDDLATWDLSRILAEADRLFTEALAEPEKLQSIPIAQYDRLLQKGTMSDAYRPTLYDFLVHEALQFYSLAEQQTRPQDAFDLPASSAIFGTRADFLAWELPAESDSPIVKSLRLYQQLMQFHAKDADRSALLDADLDRLLYGSREAYGDEAAARYRAALQRFVEDHGDHEIASLGAARWAEAIRAEGDLVAARQTAQQGARLHPQSIGAKLCQNIIAQIEQPSSSMVTERVWNAPWPTIDVVYRNMDRIYFRLIRRDVTEGIRHGVFAGEHIGAEQRKQLLTEPAAHAWSADLPATRDYRQRTESIDVPRDIAPGCYYLIASHDPSFQESNNQVSFCEVWVSNLAIVTRNRQGEARAEGMVFDARSGRPLARAEVQVWVPQRRERRQQYQLHATVRTDQDGKYTCEVPPNTPHLIWVSHQGQQLTAIDAQWVVRQDYRQQAEERTVFFTDRSLYRPGQTIQYKGICLKVDGERDQYHTISSRRVTVALRDANGQEIEQQERQANDLGSFSGSFTAPRGSVTGTMTVVVIDGPAGYAQIRVEEYKRPKFFVTVDAPREATRLNELVALTGKATSYTSAPIDGASVRYRVVREVRYPDWWFWRCSWWPQGNTSQEIAHGSTTTAADGSFSLEFPAVPDRSVPAVSEPVFHFSVHVDVVDSTGETRSASRVVQVGYAALSARLTVDDWQVTDKPVSLRIATQTLDGEPQAASGTLRVFALIPPDAVHRPSLADRPWPIAPVPGDSIRALKDIPPDWSKVATWPSGALEGERQVTIDATGTATIDWKLGAGAYRGVLETQDRFGKSVQSEVVFQVVDPQADRLAIKVADRLTAVKWTVQPGEEFTALWGSGYEDSRAFVEVEHRGQMIQSFWTRPRTTQQIIRIPVTEAMRGGFTIHVTHVRENRAYLHSRQVDVPWTNKQLAVRWERFVSKLKPGAKETWTAVITGPDAQAASAEMVATLYDASLDAFWPHAWAPQFDFFRRDYSRLQQGFQNQLRLFQVILYGWTPHVVAAEVTYRHLPPELAMASGIFRGGQVRMGLAFERLNEAVPAPAAMAMAEDQAGERGPVEFRKSMAAMDGAGAGAPGERDAAPAPDARLDQVAGRTNLRETAFFFPHLLTDDQGTVRMEFVMPEALTEWRFLGFAHDRDARSGLLTGTTVTAKDLMVQPNPPRFLREGDQLEFTVKVTNQSPTNQKGTVRLTLSDAQRNESVDTAFGNLQPDQAFDIPPGTSRSFHWRLSVPDAAGMIIYKAVGASDRLSDGEEGFLPILSRRQLVIESLPLPIRGNQTRAFDFQRMREAMASPSLRSESLTVQVTSQPAWYAVLALPYLMEFPHECSEQVFNRLYANALARHIATSDPQIRRIFDQWRGTDALDSPLLKNEDLRSVAIQETPWLLEARSESEARRNVGILFDENRLNDEIARTLARLTQMQYADGSWPWFPGGKANEFITLYVVTGFGRLRHLGVDLDVAPAVKALAELDHWIDEQYDQIAERKGLESNNLSPTICLYLYGRSFFLQDQPVAAAERVAVDYFLAQARDHWAQLGDRMTQGYLAIALQRFGDRQTPKAIVRSLTERSRSSDEMGMFWREGESSWWWYRAPIETQALMIEVYDEVAADTKSVEELKIWLLKQKQTQDWKTTKATADAVYALLLRGASLLSANELVTIELGGKELQPETVEAGTGYFARRFGANEITPAMATIRMVNPNDGIAWGSVHWQYFEDIAAITPFEGSPLKLKKSLYLKENTDRGPTLAPVTGEVPVGAELVTRIELRVDRAMEFVHLRDHRGSGTEPVDVLSQYRFQDGLAYYQATRDTATHFFIDYLPRGTYVLEYSVRVQHRGQYQTGMAHVECMYAPEFNSHSESLPLVVK